LHSFGIVDKQYYLPKDETAPLKALFGKDFVRNQNADGINAVLNYGYSIIRATIARSIVASGLHPAIVLRTGSVVLICCLRIF
jgi:CRISPR/Cas system-associated endonuclease Cas1